MSTETATSRIRLALEDASGDAVTISRDDLAAMLDRLDRHEQFIADVRSVQREGNELLERDRRVRAHLELVEYRRHGKAAEGSKA